MKPSLKSKKHWLGITKTFRELIGDALGSLITTGVTVINYTNSAKRSLDSYQSIYTADELALLAEKWDRLGGLESISGLFNTEEIRLLPEVWRTTKKISILEESYNKEEIKALDDKWKREEDSLNNADVCGFNDGLVEAKEVLTKLLIDLPQEKLEELQESAKRYRFSQRQALEREAEKKCANRARVEIFADMINFLAFRFTRS